MKGKLILGTYSVTRMLFTQAFCFRIFHKWSRFSLSNSKQLPYRNNLRFSYEIYNRKQCNFARSPKTNASSANEDIFFQLKYLMTDKCLRRKNIDEALKNKDVYRDPVKSLLVLQCISKLPDISPKDRVALSENFLNTVKSFTGAINEAHCLQVLECYLQSKYFENLDSFLSMMKNYGVDQSKEIQLSVMKCLSVQGQKNINFDLVSLQNLNSEDIEELNAVKIYHLAVSGGINKAVEKIKQMKENHIPIGSKIYTSLLKAAALKGVCIEKLVQDVLLEGITFSDDQISDILETIVLSKNYNLVSDVKLLCVDAVLLRTSHNLMVKVLHSDNEESAYNFLIHLFSLKFIGKSDDIQLFLNAVCKSFIEESYKVNCSLNGLIEKCKEIRKSKKYIYSLEHLLYCCLKKKDMKESLLVLNVMFNEDLPIESHYFWPLFMTAKEKFSGEGIIFVLDRMAELKVPLTPDTVMDYVFPNMSDIYFAEVILKRVCLIEAQRELFIELLALYAVKNKLFKEGINLVEKHPLRSDKSYPFLNDSFTEALLEDPYCEDIVILAKKTDALNPLRVFSQLWFRNDINGIKQLSEYFEKHKIYTENVREAEAFIQLNENQPAVVKAVSKVLDKSKTNAETDDDYLKHKKRSRYEEFQNIENAEVLLAEMKAKNLNTAKSKLRLIKLYAMNQLFDKAVKVKNELLEMTGKDTEFTPGYLILLARLSAYEKDTDRAMDYFNTLKKKYPNFQFGCITGLTLCLHFMEHNRPKEMLNVLRCIPKWEGTFESIWPKPVQLLREVSKSGIPELTDIVFKILLQKKCLTEDANTLQVYTNSYLYACIITEEITSTHTHDKRERRLLPPHRRDNRLADEISQVEHPECLLKQEAGRTADSRKPSLSLFKSAMLENGDKWNRVNEYASGDLRTKLSHWGNDRNNLDGAVEEYKRIYEHHGVVSNTTTILWSLVKEDRKDLIHKLISIYLEKSRNKNALASTLTLIASKGDVDFLTSYSKKLEFPLDDKVMIRKFTAGEIPLCSVVAFKTLISAALMDNLPYNHFILGTVHNIILGKNYEGARDFLDFCGSHNINLDENMVNQLRIQSELGEILAASVPGKDKIQKNNRN